MCAPAPAVLGARAVGPVQALDNCWHQVPDLTAAEIVAALVDLKHEQCTARFVVNIDRAGVRPAAVTMAKTKPLRVSSRRATVPPDILRTRSESTLMGDLSLTVLIKLNFSFIAISSCWPENLSQTGCLSAQGGVLPHIHRWIPLAPGKWIAAGPKLTAAGSAG